MKTKKRKTYYERQQNKKFWEDMALLLMIGIVAIAFAGASGYCMGARTTYTHTSECKVNK